MAEIEIENIFYKPALDCFSIFSVHGFCYEH